MSDTPNANTDRRWWLPAVLSAIAILVVIVVAGVFIRRSQEETKLRTLIDPILTRHRATVAVDEGKLVWLSMNSIDPSNVGNAQLQQIGITRFHSSQGLQGAQVVRDTDVTPLLIDLPHLRVLDLRQTETTSAVLKQVRKLEHLQWLWLGEAHCTSESIDDLLWLTNLRRLTIDGTNLSDADLQRLTDGLPKCEIQFAP